MSSRKRPLTAAAAAADDEEEGEEEDEEEEEPPPCSQEVEASVCADIRSKKRYRINVDALIERAAAKATTTDRVLAKYLFKHASKGVKDLGFSFLSIEELSALNSSFGEPVAFNEHAIGQSINRMHGRVMKLVGELHHQTEDRN